MISYSKITYLLFYFYLYGYSIIVVIATYMAYSKKQK